MWLNLYHEFPFIGLNNHIQFRPEDHTFSYFVSVLWFGWYLKSDSDDVFLEVI